jgi:hypothetical protein
MSVAHQVTTEWLTGFRGGDAAMRPFAFAGYSIAGVFAAAALLYALYWLSGKVIRFGFLARLRRLISKGRQSRSVEFYEQLIEVLRARGLQRGPSETPLEFALATNLPEAVAITEQYQKVRFGERELSEPESNEMSELIRRLKNGR